ncbi:ABC transporter substrate-binding protein [Winogradskyella sp. 3972H.M.0a.05]|uniref:type IX secretion system anionic LPS delivery protein PorZ n=1 Tax=Winogradskyella sp. 3972H.M.0a.05 TaxID=2950277 RepID=UPI00339982DD
MLRKITLFITAFTITFSTLAQDFSNLWEGHFSYFDIVDLTRSETKLYAAAENAIFSYDFNTNEIETLTTVEGLSGSDISTILFSDTFNTLIIGYESGLIELYFESDQDLLSVVDILDKPTISPENKRINHFNEHEGFIYISTNFGVSVYDLQRLEFGDSYFLGNGGAQITVEQTTIFNDAIYAACRNGNGMKKGALDNPNLIDFQEWQNLVPGNYVAVESVGNSLLSIRLSKDFFNIENDVFSLISTFNTLPVHTSTFNDQLVVTEDNLVSVFDENANELFNINAPEDLDIEFTSSVVFGNEIYIGTNNQGVLKFTTDNLLEFEEIRPEGPLMNNAFKIDAQNDKVWVTYGDFNVFFDPAPVRRRGLSYRVDEQWINIPYDSLFTARNLCYIAVNPFNDSQVFISSFIDGIVELENENPVILYNSENSGLDPLLPTLLQERVGGLKFDRNGLLWSVSAFVREPLKSYDPASGQWQSYELSEIIPDINQIGNVFDDGELGFADIDIDENGTKWIGSFFNGLIGFNENLGGVVMNNVNTPDQNMPTTKVRALAVDQRNQIWIGTDFGLRVLFNTANFFDNPNPTVSEIIILEDGIPKELLDDQFITDIKVDGSNNKWIGTLSSGIFYLSSDGQETIYHFTKDNSPLPSNQIKDISIDNSNGEVFIATSKGLLSFTAGGSKPEETLGDAYVYPNPVRPEYNILGFGNLNDINKGVKIQGLTENVNVKITDIEGNLVAEAQSGINLRNSKANYNFAIDGGTGIWNGKNLRGNIVATGVYLILISDLDSFETKTLKLLIVR